MITPVCTDGDAAGHCDATGGVDGGTTQLATV